MKKLLVTLIALISAQAFAQQVVKIEPEDQVDWGTGNSNCHGRIEFKDSANFKLESNKIILTFEIEKKDSNTELGTFPLRILVVDALHGKTLTFVHMDQIFYETKYQAEIAISAEDYQQLMADSFVGLDFYTGKAGCEGRNLRITYMSNLK